MRTLLLFSCLALLTACRHTNPPSGYDSLTYNTSLPADHAFTAMNDRFDQGLFPGMIDSTTKASTDVKLVLASEGESRSVVLEHLRCRAWIDVDTLRIDISQADGFTAHGLLISIKDKRFKCTPFYFSDAYVPDDEPPAITIKKQQLTLNTQTFHIGDSLYGYINMKALVGRQEKSATGYFRTIIRERYD